MVDYGTATAGRIPSDDSGSGQDVSFAMLGAQIADPRASSRWPLDSGEHQRAAICVRVVSSAYNGIDRWTLGCQQPPSMNTTLVLTDRSAGVPDATQRRGAQSGTGSSIRIAVDAIGPGRRTQTVGTRRHGITNLRLGVQSNPIYQHLIQSSGYESEHDNTVTITFMA
jgi:hypothetical protein